MTAPEVHARPRNYEVALIHHPGPVRVHGSDSGFRDLWPMRDGEPVIATVPGDPERLGYGAARIRYSRLRAARNGHHRLDRAVWDAAVLAVRGGGVVYVQFDRIPYQGALRWTATGVRPHIDRPAFRVTFERIGRHVDPADLVIDPLTEQDPDALWGEVGLQIGGYARRFLGSRGLEVELDTDLMRGRLLVGVGRPAGAFRVAEFGLDTVDTQDRAAG